MEVAEGLNPKRKTETIQKPSFLNLDFLDPEFDKIYRGDLDDSNNPVENNFYVIHNANDKCDFNKMKPGIYLYIKGTPKKVRAFVKYDNNEHEYLDFTKLCSKEGCHRIAQIVKKPSYLNDGSDQQHLPITVKEDIRNFITSNCQRPHAFIAFSKYSDAYDKALYEFNQKFEDFQNTLLIPLSAEGKIAVLDAINDLRQKIFDREGEIDKKTCAKIIKEFFELQPINAICTTNNINKESLKKLLRKIIYYKTVLNKNLKYIKEKIKDLKEKKFPDLIEKIKAKATAEGFVMSDQTANEILRRENIAHTTKLLTQIAEANQGFGTKFNISHLGNVEPNAIYVSTQTPVEGIPFRCCFTRHVNTDTRDENSNVAALRKDTLAVVDTEGNLVDTLYELYIHTSVSPKQIKNFEERQDSIIQETKNLAENIGQGKSQSLTEIRLLSPTQKEDGKQILETFVGAVLSGKDVNIFAYGVNFFRHAHGIKNTGTQTRINTISTNQLLEKLIENKCGEIDYIKGARKERNAFFANIRTLYSTHTSEKIFKEELEKLMKKHHSHEKALLKKYESYFKGNSLIEKNPDIDLLFRLRSKEMLSPNFNSEFYHGQIQAVLYRLNKAAGRNVALGCDDAKDRASAIAIIIQASEIFYRKHQYYPFTENTDGELELEKDRKLLDDLERQVYENSVHKTTAEWFSQPFVAKGLDNVSRSTETFNNMVATCTNFYNENRLARSHKKMYDADHPKPLTSDKELVKYLVSRLMAAQDDETLQKELDGMRQNDTFKDLEGEVLRYFEAEFDTHYQVFDEYGKDFDSTAPDDTTKLKHIKTLKHLFEKPNPKLDIDSVNIIDDNSTSDSSSVPSFTFHPKAASSSSLNPIEKSKTSNRNYTQCPIKNYVRKAQEINAALNENSSCLKQALNGIKEDRTVWGKIARMGSNIFKFPLFIFSIPFSYAETGSVSFWKVRGERVADTSEEKFLSAFKPASPGRSG